MQNLKELINFSNLCNFQLFAIIIERNISHRKVRNCWVARKLMSHTFFVKFRVFTALFTNTRALKITSRIHNCIFPKRSVKMIDGSEKRKRQLVFEVQSSRVYEKRSKREFLRNHSVNRAQIFRDNWNFYYLSIFRDFILLASSNNDEHMLMRQNM